MMWTYALQPVPWVPSSSSASAAAKEPSRLRRRRSLPVFSGTGTVALRLSASSVSRCSSKAREADRCAPANPRTSGPDRVLKKLLQNCTKYNVPSRNSDSSSMFCVGTACAESETVTAAGLKPNAQVMLRFSSSFIIWPSELNIRTHRRRRRRSSRLSFLLDIVSSLGSSGMEWRSRGGSRELWWLKTNRELNVGGSKFNRE